MRITRVYTPQTLAVCSTITLEEQASTHLHRVLRHKFNDAVIVFNGQGAEFLGRISAIHKKHLDIFLEEPVIVNAESPLQSHIAIGVSKGDKMDWIIQKCTELGVNAIHPILTERCDVKIDADRWQKKVDRWQEIAISACEQSGRSFVPKVNDVISFNLWLSNNPHPAMIFHPTGTKTFLHAKTASTMYMAFGPEGGFSDTEIAQAEKMGALICNLGTRILRAETAPIAALAIAQAQWGDLTK